MATSKISNKRTVHDRKALHIAVLAECESLCISKFGKLPSITQVEISKEELEAQRLFAEMRRSLNNLMKLARAGVSGPCTKYLHSRIDVLESIAAEEPWQSGYRWRQHSGFRSSCTATVVDTYGSTVFDGARLTDIELAWISIGHGAPLSPSARDVTSCIRAEAERIRADRNRRASSRLPATPTRKKRLPARM